MLSSNAASSLPNVKGRFIVRDDMLYEVQSFYFKGGSIPQNIPQIAYKGQVAPYSDIDSDIIDEQIEETATNTESFEFDFSEFRK